MAPTPLDARAARFGALASVFGLTAVAAGAFGAHALREQLPTTLLTTFETAARYQLIHAVALLAVAWLVDRNAHPLAATAGWLFVAGIVLFSGSLYALALSGIGMLGVITPFGGLCLMAGWLCLLLAFARGGAVR